MRAQSCQTLIPGIVAHQSPLPMEYSRQEYWSGLPFPSSGDLPNPGIGTGFSCISCIGRQILLPLSHLGSLKTKSVFLKNFYHAMLERGGKMYFNIELTHLYRHSPSWVDDLVDLKMLVD